MKEELIAEGTLTLTFAVEQEDLYDYSRLEFDPPLEIKWSVYEDEKGKMAYVDYDFGMTDRFSIDTDKNFLTWGYGGLTQEKLTPENIVERTVIFDLFHAFTHCDMDPNYGHLHWALYGNLKHKTKVIENYD